MGHLDTDVASLPKLSKLGASKFELVNHLAVHIFLWIDKKSVNQNKDSPKPVETNQD
jgi:hypothetical protein